jgi:hypothetical protein
VFSHWLDRVSGPCDSFSWRKSQVFVAPCCNALYIGDCAASLTPLPFLGVSSLLTFAAPPGAAFFCPVAQRNP